MAFLNKTTFLAGCKNQQMAAHAWQLYEATNKRKRKSRLPTAGRAQNSTQLAAVPKTAEAGGGTSYEALSVIAAAMGLQRAQEQTEQRRNEEQRRQQYIEDLAAGAAYWG